jgi:hypothetical protein
MNFGPPPPWFLLPSGLRDKILTARSLQDLLLALDKCVHYVEHNIDATTNTPSESEDEPVDCSLPNQIDPEGY